MKCIVFLLIIFLVVSTHTFSQENKTNRRPSIQVGAQTSLAVGDLAETHSVGLGAHVLGTYPVGKATSLTGRLSYTYLFGKSYSNSYYTDPGGPGGGYGGGTYNGKYDGMNDIGLTVGARQQINNNWFAGLEGGLCFDSGGDHSETSGMGSVEFGYAFTGNLYQALAFFLGLCGDPKIQIGLRYSIRL